MMISSLGQYNYFLKTYFEGRECNINDESERKEFTEAIKKKNIKNQEKEIRQLRVCEQNINDIDKELNVLKPSKGYTGIKLNKIIEILYLKKIKKEKKFILP